MNIVYLIAAILSVLLSIYLVVALLKPEWFE
jgi:K+-transporting ATPase KdpF subunit